MPGSGRRRAIRRSVAVLAGTLAGCFVDPSETPSDAPSTTENGITYSTTIDLVSPAVGDVEDEPIEPLVYDELPRDEREILEAAHGPGEYSVTYELDEGPPDNEKTAGLRSLIDRILDRHTAQQEDYREHSSSESVPEHVDAVYLNYEDEVYCIELVDGDVKYYHC